jgi:hypothetical protein
MCAQKVLDCHNLDYYAQDVNVAEPFEQTGHDGVIMWGSVGTFGFEDHDPVFVAKYLNEFWSGPIAKHCAKSNDVTRSATRNAANKALRSDEVAALRGSIKTDDNDGAVGFMAAPFYSDPLFDAAHDAEFVWHAGEQTWW